MNILVTGGAGYIGSIVVEELIKKYHSVLIIDNLQEGHRESVSPTAEFYEGDVGNKKLIEKIFTEHNIDAVLHFAAETTIDYSMTDPSLYFRNNVVNGISLLDVMLKHDCKQFIFSSTAAIFGEPRYTPIDEKHHQSPVNAYGESKLMFEKVLDWYNKAYGLKFNAFRYFNAAGASEKLGEDHRHESHLIPVIINSILKQNQHEGFQIFGNDYTTRDGTCIRDYVHVLDLAQAHILGLDNLNKNPKGKYNLGNGKGFSNLEIVKTVEKVSRKKIYYSFGDRRKGDPAILVASSDLAKNELGWEPEFTNIDDIIKTAWEWHKKHPNGYNKK